ncbi:MAG: hypothetical protein VX617_00215 [Pseudomonadota bacterium]|nr:hypothetical protein [Pseudomonadota bacterium]
MLPATPVISPMSTLIEKLRNLALKFGWARPITLVCPNFTPEWEHPKTMLHNIFGSIEDWQYKYYRFDLVDNFIPGYGQAYRHVVCNYVAKRLYAILAISDFQDTNGKNSFYVSGLPPDIIEAHEIYSSTVVESTIWPLKMPNFLVNFIIAVLIIIFTLFWTLSRIRPFLRPAKKYSVMADYNNDPSDINLYEEMADLGDVCLIRRSDTRFFNPHQDTEYTNNISKYDMYRASNGALEPMQAVLGLWKAIAEGIKIYCFAGKYEPALFYKLISLPYKSIVYRSLFRRFRPKIFWSNDAYNVEHIIRRQELKAVNGQSWCFLHGYPTYAPIFPMFRYLSFDKLYAVSRHFYERDYVDTWNSDIEVVDASTDRASRRIFAKRLPVDQKPSDIIVLCGIFVIEPRIVDFVTTLASNFPERKIYFQIKKKFRELNEGKSLVNACIQKCPNIDVSTPDIYELFTKAKYVFSDPSTAIMEGLQFGSMVFSVDISDIQVVSPLREFGDICVNSGQSATRVIKSIEDGSWVYPFELIKPLANIDGECFEDRLRRDLGLNPREVARPVW